MKKCWFKPTFFRIYNKVKIFNLEIYSNGKNR